jgi:hypothetical protein
MKRIFIIASCALLLLAAGCKDKQNEPQSISGSQDRPAWTVSDDYEMVSSMTAVVKVDLSLTYPEQVSALSFSPSADDLLAAFSGETCIGLADYVDGLFFIYITGTSEPVRLRFYSSELKNTFVSEDTFPFRNDTQEGTTAQPFTPAFVLEAQQ